MGAPGRRFESCRSDSINQSHTSELPKLAFLLLLLVGDFEPTYRQQINFYPVDTLIKILKETFNLCSQQLFYCFSAYSCN